MQKNANKPVKYRIQNFLAILNVFGMFSFILLSLLENKESAVNKNLTS